MALKSPVDRIDKAIAEAEDALHLLKTLRKQIVSLHKVPEWSDKQEAKAMDIDSTLRRVFGFSVW